LHLYPFSKISVFSLLPAIGISKGKIQGLDKLVLPCLTRAVLIITIKSVLICIEGFETIPGETEFSGGVMVWYFELYGRP
jgi:hypothetical protein